MMMDVSICMVSLNCWNVLQDCLESLRASCPALRYEVIIVDNGSSDGTQEQIRQQFPEVRLVANGRNVGFSKATNQGIALSQGRYLLWLNTDTILRPDALYQLCMFLESRPRAGIVGPRVHNPDGTFQPQCRRGLPTPAASLCYLLKLDHLWPQNRLAGQYLLTYLPVDQDHPVVAVSGCCLMARRQVWDEIGPLDERIFAFGEDIDWCVRAQKAGWEVWYTPRSEIVHLKGQGGVHVKPFHKVWGMHQGMWVFYRKHLASQHRWPTTALVYAGIGGSMALACARACVGRAVRRPRTDMKAAASDAERRAPRN